MVKREFIDAVRSGREIEFTCNGKSYFESHKSDDSWYIYSESDRTKQCFKSANDLLKNALIDGVPLNELWDDIQIEYIL
jgi:hypothetical protein